MFFLLKKITMNEIVNLFTIFNSVNQNLLIREREREENIKFHLLPLQSMNPMCGTLKSCQISVLNIFCLILHTIYDGISETSRRAQIFAPIGHQKKTFNHS